MNDPARLRIVLLHQLVADNALGITAYCLPGIDLTPRAGLIPAITGWHDPAAMAQPPNAVASNPRFGPTRHATPMPDPNRVPPTKAATNPSSLQSRRQELAARSGGGMTAATAAAFASNTPRPSAPLPVPVPIATASTPPSLPVNPSPQDLTDTRQPIPDDPIARAQLLADLAQRASTCTACELSRARRQVVFGCGAATAPLVIIGEAPGATEDQQGEPFVGPAGQLLDRQLAAIQLTRSDVYILNTVKCRPPGNREPAPAEKQACRPWLDRQLQLIRPAAMLALGGHAGRTMLNQTSATVDSMRGRIHDVAGIPLIVTYHPAYLLRQGGEGHAGKRPIAYQKTWDDLKRLRELLRELGVLPQQPNDNSRSG